LSRGGPEHSGLPRRAGLLRAVWAGAVSLAQGGLYVASGALVLSACTLAEDDFSPTRVELPQEVQQSGNTGGGAAIAQCANPDGCCESDEDCQTGMQCAAGTCVAQSCSMLEDISTCELQLCTGPDCARQDCDDGVQNGSEDGVDCGGDCPNACLEATLASCNDELLNQDETDVDCGGSCSANCEVDAACEGDDDCVPGSFCSPSARLCTDDVSCSDEIRNGDEVLTDCGGGTCPGCAPGTTCSAGVDCSSGVCSQGSCQAPASCDDDQLNGDESGVDCGGSDQSCQRCPDRETCRADTDCANDSCVQGVCVSCNDGLRNAGETDIDCGGADVSCDRCQDDDSCAFDRDCLSGNCQGGVCVNFACDDNLRNGNESDTDCGGNDPGCDACGDGDTCRQAADCASNSCAAGVCISCDDGLRNGGESDVDCGGTSACGACAPGLACGADNDCTSGACVDGRCCGGSQGDCTRCAERLSPTIDCAVPTAGVDSTGVTNCRAFLECLANNPDVCATRNASGCSGDNQNPGGDACPHNNYGGNAGTGLTRANQVLQNAACTL
jgi:hypothetical protein